MTWLTPIILALLLTTRHRRKHQNQKTELESNQNIWNQNLTEILKYLDDEEYFLDIISFIV